MSRGFFGKIVSNLLILAPVAQTPGIEEAKRARHGGDFGLAGEDGLAVDIHDARLIACDSKGFAAVVTGKTSVSQATPLINQMNYSALYNHLTTRLTYTEARNYVSGVTRRMEKYIKK